MGRTMKPAEVGKALEKTQQAISLKLLSSKFLEKRILGMSEMNDLIVRVHNREMDKKRRAANPNEPSCVLRGRVCVRLTHASHLQSPNDTVSDCQGHVQVD